MRSRCRVLDSKAVCWILLLAAAATSAMLIQDVDTPEDPGDTDIDATSIQTSPATSRQPPPVNSTNILQKVGWVCSFVEPISNISLDTIMGRWYLVEVLSPSDWKRHDACAGVDIWRWDEEDNNLFPDLVPPDILGRDHVVMRGFNRHVNNHHTSSYSTDTAAVVEGSGGALWDQPVRSVSAYTVSMAATVAVLDYTPDARFMTVSTCVSPVGLEWTSVLSRQPNATALDREALHQRLRAAGIRYLDGSKLQDNADCVYVESQYPISSKSAAVT